jgi:hypothetical protein
LNGTCYAGGGGGGDNLGSGTVGTASCGGGAGNDSGTGYSGTANTGGGGGGTSSSLAGGNGASGVAFIYFTTSSANETIRFTSSGNVGIDTSSPVNSLDIGGSEAIGSNYAGVYTAPVNGLLVKGNVGIGSITPGQILDVTGTIRGVGGLFSSNVGIGVTPVNKLDIGAGSTIGSGYAGVYTAPVNGLLVQGNISIGTSVSTSTLQFGGTCKAIGPVGTCWTSTGQIGYCSGAAGVCSTCTAC